MDKFLLLFEEQNALVIKAENELKEIKNAEKDNLIVIQNEKSFIEVLNKEIEELKKKQDVIKNLDKKTRKAKINNMIFSIEIFIILETLVLSTPEIVASLPHFISTSIFAFLASIIAGCMGYKSDTKEIKKIAEFNTIYSLEDDILRKVKTLTKAENRLMAAENKNKEYEEKILFLNNLINDLNENIRKIISKLLESEVLEEKINNNFEESINKGEILLRVRG